MNRSLQGLFFLLVVRPVVLLALGLRVQNRDGLPAQGPAILIANHNSHLDTWVLMTLFPIWTLPHLRPVAAADYFFRNSLWTWFFQTIFNVIAIERRGSSRQLFKACGSALAQGDILILYPEGSRGLPEQKRPFQTGIAHLSQKHPQVPVIPIFLHGLGKALPKGEALLVPFFCDVVVGSPLYWTGQKSSFMDQLENAFTKISKDCYRPDWN
ncbi:lysophospholipid acyltransferase family protein [Lyngbya confervoides]|uniref:1-acyl-sn-glycerol-3-phosphate acyltransferase n=1 Tax=Lyngbya confervoides BDU141951 TaxID=1574623 RepID=A0ABD4T555_9CYAN|nr:lysophospholipid acyltransferase family protein [Lyngbya confervoides]MCM1983690.1 1-acyl-sn-glycerol-3-phosphate acyltransferase [Lyngbya confervoides BDU141951]